MLCADTTVTRDQRVTDTLGIAVPPRDKSRGRKAMSTEWELHYDRRVSADFLAHFQADGVARSLVEYARHAPYPLDLQMRASPKSPAEHATLYVGLTAVLNVHHKKGGLALSAHPTHANSKAGFASDWKQPADVQTWSTRWRHVEAYLEGVIPAVAGSKHAAREGAVQAAASVFATKNRVMLDREAALHFHDNPTKSRIFSEVTSPVLAAVQAVEGVPGKKPTRFGGECDLLAVDEEGRLLAVEVKPRGAGTIRWAAAQATVYARLFQRWIAALPTGDSPGQILRGMIRQRVDLGLAETVRPDIPDQPDVVPVVAVQREAAETYLDGLRRVQRQLLASGAGDERLRLYEVNMAGRLDRIPL